MSDSKSDDEKNRTQNNKSEKGSGDVKKTLAHNENWEVRNQISDLSPFEPKR